MDDAILENWFTYHRPSESDIPKYAALRQAARTFASGAKTARRGVVGSR